MSHGAWWKGVDVCDVRSDRRLALWRLHECKYIEKDAVWNVFGVHCGDGAEAFLSVMHLIEFLQQTIHSGHSESQSTALFFTAGQNGRHEVANFLISWWILSGCRAQLWNSIVHQSSGAPPSFQALTVKWFAVNPWIVMEMAAQNCKTHIYREKNPHIWTLYYIFILCKCFMLLINTNLWR